METAAFKCIPESMIFASIAEILVLFHSCLISSKPWFNALKNWYLSWKTNSEPEGKSLRPSNVMWRNEMQSNNSTEGWLMKLWYTSYPLNKFGTVGVEGTSCEKNSFHSYSSWKTNSEPEGKPRRSSKVIWRNAMWSHDSTQDGLIKLSYASSPLTSVEQIWNSCGRRGNLWKNFVFQAFLSWLQTTVELHAYYYCRMMGKKMNSCSTHLESVLFWNLSLQTGQIKNNQCIVISHWRLSEAHPVLSLWSACGSKQKIHCVSAVVLSK